VLAVLAAAALAAPTSCASAPVAPAHAARVDRILRSGRDVWGDQLLRAPGGPTYDRARRYLPPLLLARTSKQRPLTRSGAYYLPFSHGRGVMLHVADGGEIFFDRVGGPSVTIFAGNARFAACNARLADGWLPILQTTFRGTVQESFAARAGGRLTSFVALRGNGALRVGSVRGRGELYVAWSRAARRVDRAEYERARQSVVDYWTKRVLAPFEVPERVVFDAERALLVQNLVHTWRYSIGNPYEEFSFPESVDGAQVMAEYGYADVAASMLRASLTRRPEPYANWKRGEKLVGSALLYRLHRDRAYVAAVTPTLRGYVDALARQLGPRNLLARERFSSDIPDQVYGLHAQAVVWQGLREMSAVWSETGRRALAVRAAATAARLERGLRAEVRASARRLPDGSLFVPVRLLDREPAYGAVTATREGSYWNLVAPYAFASGLFPPHGRDAAGILRYLDLHGARLLGLVRAGAFSLYGPAAYPAGGTDQVYGLNVARFLADNDQSDRLVLQLYGQLAAAMTPNTFVAGEAASVAPLRGRYYRAMYLPPNSVSNAAFLETLRQILVHETSTGLELAYATPRAWLAPGKRVAVHAAPTRFGPLSYALEATKDSVHVDVDVPARAQPRTLRLRLRLPGGRTRTLDLSGRRGHVELEVRVA
jgi:hypothetical protein